MNAVCKRRSRKPFKPALDVDTCALCLGSQRDEEKYGKFFQSEKEQLAAHQFCLFFASGLAQNGEDEEGFDGFLFDDIRVEVSRASKLMCTLCKKKGASIGCSVLKCKAAFHFCCGLERLALFQYFGSFCAFCRYHRPSQNVKSTSQLCPICLCDIDNIDRINSISSPCCKNSLFHRTCLQKQALSSGLHFFRCALCNNLEMFQQEMNRMGIYIPERDAAWEQGDAYADLLQSYNKCDSSTCLCPNGRDFTGDHEGKKWEICLCHTCGQSGTHLQCKGWARPLPRWLCNDCEIISLNNSLESRTSLEASPKLVIDNKEPLSTSEVEEAVRTNEQALMFTSRIESPVFVESSSETSSIVESLGSSSVQSHNLVDLVADPCENSRLMTLTSSSSVPGNDSDKISEASSGALPDDSSNCHLVENSCDILRFVAPVCSSDSLVQEKDETSSLESESTIMLEDSINSTVYSTDEMSDHFQEEEATFGSLSERNNAALLSKKRRFLPCYKKRSLRQNIRERKQKKCKNQRSKLSPNSKQNGLSSTEKDKESSSMPLLAKECLQSLEISHMHDLAKDHESEKNASMSCSEQVTPGNDYRTDSSCRMEIKKKTKKNTSKSISEKAKVTVNDSVNGSSGEECGGREIKFTTSTNQTSNHCSKSKYRRKQRKQRKRPIKSSTVQDTTCIIPEQSIKANSSWVTMDKLLCDSEDTFTKTESKEYQKEDTFTLINDSHATNGTESTQNQQINISKSTGKLDVDGVSNGEDNLTKITPKPRTGKEAITSWQDPSQHGLNGSFSLSLDVSADSETLGSCVKPGTSSTYCNVSITSDRKDEASQCLTPSKSSQKSPISSSPFLSNYNPDGKNVSPCFTPSKSPKKSPSSRSPCIKSRKSLSGQLDLYGMLTSQRRKKRKLSPELKKFSTEGKSPKKLSKRLKRRKVDTSCHRSITSYMSVSPKKKTVKAEKSPLQSCIEAASQLFSSTLSRLSGLYQKNDSEDDFVGNSSSKSLNTSVLTDSDTDSTSSVKVVKVVKKKGCSEGDTDKTQHALYSSDDLSLTIVLDDDSDGQDSGKGGSRDNSDGAISCTSFSDCKGSNEELNESCRVEVDSTDEGIFLGSDDSKEISSNLVARHDDDRTTNQSSQMMEKGDCQEMAAKLSKQSLNKAKQLTSSPKMRKRKILRKNKSSIITPNESSILDQTSSKTHCLSSQNVNSDTQSSIPLKRKLNNIERCSSSSVVEESSSDESVAPLRKRHRTLSLSKTAKANLYNECSDEDFQCKKRRSSFKLIICQNKQRRTKKKLDESFLTIDLSSQEI